MSAPQARGSMATLTRVTPSPDPEQYGQVGGRHQDGEEGPKTEPRHQGHHDHSQSSGSVASSLHTHRVPRLRPLHLSIDAPASYDDAMPGLQQQQQLEQRRREEALAAGDICRSKLRVDSTPVVLGTAKMGKRSRSSAAAYGGRVLHVTRRPPPPPPPLPPPPPPPLPSPSLLSASVRSSEATPAPPQEEQEERQEQGAPAAAAAAARARDDGTTNSSASAHADQRQRQRQRQRQQQQQHSGRRSAMPWSAHSPPSSPQRQGPQQQQQRQQGQRQPRQPRASLSPSRSPSTSPVQQQRQQSWAQQARASRGAIMRGRNRASSIPQDGSGPAGYNEPRSTAAIAASTLVEEDEEEEDEEEEEEGQRSRQVTRQRAARSRDRHDDDEGDGEDDEDNANNGSGRDSQAQLQNSGSNNDNASHDDEDDEGDEGDEGDGSVYSPAWRPAFRKSHSVDVSPVESHQGRGTGGSRSRHSVRSVTSTSALNTALNSHHSSNSNSGNGDNVIAGTHHDHTRVTIRHARSASSGYPPSGSGGGRVHHSQPRPYRRQQSEDETSLRPSSASSVRRASEGGMGEEGVKEDDDDTSVVIHQGYDQDQYYHQRSDVYPEYGQQQQQQQQHHHHHHDNWRNSRESAAAATGMRAHSLDPSRMTHAGGGADDDGDYEDADEEEDAQYYPHNFRQLEQYSPFHGQQVKFPPGHFASAPTSSAVTPTSALSDDESQQHATSPPGNVGAGAVVGGSGGLPHPKGVVPRSNSSSVGSDGHHEEAAKRRRDSIKVRRAPWAKARDENGQVKVSVSERTKKMLEEQQQAADRSRARSQSVEHFASHTSSEPSVLAAADKRKGGSHRHAASDGGNAGGDDRTRSADARSTTDASGGGGKGGASASKGQKTDASRDEEEEEEEESWLTEHWRVTVATVALVVVTALGVLFRLFAPDKTIATASVAAWALYVGSLILLIPILTVLVRVFGLLFMATFLRHSRRFQVIAYYTRTLRLSLIRFLWSLCALVAWHVVFAYDFFPPHRKPNAEINTLDELWWVTRLLWCDIVLHAFGIVRQFVSKSVALKRRAESYHQRVRQVAKAAHLLTLLSRPIPPRMITLKHRPAVKRKAKRTPRVTFDVPHTSKNKARPEGTSEGVKKLWRRALERAKFERLHHAASASDVHSTKKSQQGKKAREEDTESVEEAANGDNTDHVYRGVGMSGMMIQQPIPRRVSLQDVDLDRLFLDADTIQKEPLWVCKKQKPIRTFKDARALGSAIFEFYTQFAGGSELRQPLDTLPVSLLKQALAHHPKAQEQVEPLLDPSGLKELSREHIMSRCTELFLERKNLSNTLADLDSIITAIDTFMAYVQAIVLFLTLIIVFSSGELSEITITAGTTILALSFVFADTCKHTFNSFVFLFSRHPFDSGDRIQIGTDGPAMYVQKMELLNTTFTHWNGTVITIPNHTLYQKDIYNIQRSGMMWDELVLHVDYRTPISKLDALEEAYRKCLREHPVDFDESNSSFLLNDLQDMSRLKLGMYYAHRTNWQNGEHVFRRSILLRHLRTACERLDITYYPPIQRAEITRMDHSGGIPHQHYSPAPSNPSAASASFPF